MQASSLLGLSLLLLVANSNSVGFSVLHVTSGCHSGTLQNSCCNPEALRSLQRVDLSPEAPGCGSFKGYKAFGAPAHSRSRRSCRVPQHHCSDPLQEDLARQRSSRIATGFGRATFGVERAFGRSEASPQLLSRLTLKALATGCLALTGGGASTRSVLRE